MYHKEIKYEVVGWNNLAQDMFE